MAQGMEQAKKDLANEIVAEQERNRLVVGGMSVMNVILAIAYLIEVAKGLRGMGEYIMVVLLTILPSILMIVTYCKTKEAKSIRYIAMIFFLILYAYVMLTTDKLIVFCYVIVLMTLLVIYGDFRISAACSISALLINIATVIKMAVTTGLTPAVLTEVEVSLACILLMTVYSIMSSSLTNKINSSRMRNLDKEKQQTSNLLDTVLEVAEAMEQDTMILRKETHKLDISVGNTKESMEDLAEGANNTAEAIQTQQEKTAEIQEYIETLSNVTNRIITHVNDSEKVVGDSQTTMNELMSQVDHSEQASNHVAKEMEELKTYTDQMQSIMALINNVASQTSLLALNASIEAARAGEAGRGFAVVATEISGLANQTSDATGDINVLIEGIGRSLEEVVKAVDYMLENTRAQTGYVNNTAKSFEQIHNMVAQIYEESEKLDEVVRTVAGANAVIVESIQNVSASTQEITAKAMETLEGSNQDKESVEKVLTTVERLKEHTNELNRSR